MSSLSSFSSVSRNRRVSMGPAQRRSRRILASLALVGSLAAPATAAAADPKPVVPVPSLDVPRYLGEWKQIAAIPQWFEALCLSDVTATYRDLGATAVSVSNRCKGPFGAAIVSKGRARVLDTTTKAQLQVSFLNVFGQWFYPDTKPNYVVVGLGASYDWAVVGDPDRTSAFVLSRTAALSTEQKTAALAALSATGFDACKLKTTKQAGGLSTVKPFCQVS